MTTTRTRTTTDRLLRAAVLSLLLPSGLLLAQNPKEPRLPNEPGDPVRPTQPDLPVEGESLRPVDPDLLPPPERRIGDLQVVTHDTILWSKRADSNLACGPVSTARGVLVGTTNGMVQLLDAARGDEVWRTRVGTPVDVRPGVLDDRVLAVDVVAGMTVLDLATGAVRRSASLTDAGVVDELAVSAAYVAAATRTGLLFLYEADSLRLSVRTRVPGSPAAAPRVVGDVAVVAFALGGLCAVGTVDGRVRWTRALAGGVNGAPGVVPREDDVDLVVVAGRSAGVVAVDVEAGREVWRHAESGAPVGLTVADGRLLVAYDDRRLVELDPLSGGTLRSVDVGVVPAYAPAVTAGGGVALISGAGVVELFDAELRRTARVALGGAPAGPPAASGTTAYVGLERRLVYRFRVD